MTETAKATTTPGSGKTIPVVGPTIWAFRVINETKQTAAEIPRRFKAKFLFLSIYVRFYGPRDWRVGLMTRLGILGLSGNGLFVFLKQTRYVRSVGSTCIHVAPSRNHA